MVVPVKSSLSMEKVKECVGNNLKLDINHNKKTLIVVGNNCKIQLGENSGLVRVVGNTCEVSVQKGTGNIEYVGNQGKVIIGSSYPEANVSYVGNNGTIKNMNSSSSRIDLNKDCDTHTSNSSQLSDSCDFLANFTVSSCNNVTITNEVGTETFPEIISMTNPHLRVHKHRNHLPTNSKTK